MGADTATSFPLATIRTALNQRSSPDCRWKNTSSPCDDQYGVSPRRREICQVPAPAGKGLRYTSLRPEAPRRRRATARRATGTASRHRSAARHRAAAAWDRPTDARARDPVHDVHEPEPVLEARQEQRLVGLDVQDQAARRARAVGVAEPEDDLPGRVLVGGVQDLPPVRGPGQERRSSPRTADATASAVTRSYTTTASVAPKTVDARRGAVGRERRCCDRAAAALRWA